MKALIIAAHGSRKPSSNRELERLTAKLEGKLKGIFDRVTHAFLQFAKPVLEETLNEIAESGVSQIIVFPFFIGAGSHILEDIPDLIEKTKQAHPEVEIILARHLGAIESILEVIIGEVTNPDIS